MSHTTAACVRSTVASIAPHSQFPKYHESHQQQGERLACGSKRKRHEVDSSLLSTLLSQLSHLYRTALDRHNTLTTAQKATSSPSGWYELMRFGRNIGRGIAATDKDLLPATAAHWRKIANPAGPVWADLNAAGSFKFSDADFLALNGWNCINDDARPTDQRCDSNNLKNLIRDPDEINTLRMDPDQLARRLGQADVQTKLKRMICQFPTEWDKATVSTRYNFVQDLESFKAAKASGNDPWPKLEAHLKSICFDNLPAGYAAADWRLHPKEFIRVMRSCGWLTEKALRKIYPNATDINITRYRLNLNKVKRKYLVNSALRTSHFYGQAAVESNQFRWMAELFNGDAYDYFRHYAKAKNYKGWLGNIKWNDGGDFRGRGFKQMTGRDNYCSYWLYRGWITASSYTADWWKNLGWWGITGTYSPGTHSNILPIQDANAIQVLDAAMRPPVIDDPDRVSTDFFICIDTAGWYWGKNKLILTADVNDAAQMTRLVRGDASSVGVTLPWPQAAHYSDRLAHTNRILKYLSDTP